MLRFDTEDKIKSYCALCFVRKEGEFEEGEGQDHNGKEGQIGERNCGPEEEELRQETSSSSSTAPLVTEELLAKLHGLTPLTIQQQTPIRVLHRRSLLTRPRTIHTMTATRVSDTFFKVGAHFPDNDNDVN